MNTRLFSSLLSIWLMGSCTALTLTPVEPESTSTAAAASTPVVVDRPTQINASASWIEVDLVNQKLVLHEGERISATYSASTGVTSDARYATPPGLYQVQSKEPGPIESVPDVFVSDIIMFDIRNGNGIHSRPMDANGNVLDPTLGQPATAGCVRVENSASVFEFAQLGMWVWIH